jgi:hypothetical protein
MTEHAIFRGRVVSPKEFMALAGPDFREKGLYPECPACGDPVSPYGPHSVKVTSRFFHAKGSTCSLSSSPDPRYAHLRPRGWDPAAGQRLKAEFCGAEALKQGYAVCQAICLASLRGAEFLDFCAAADRRRVWTYADLPLWAVPYLFVTLADLPPNPKARHPARKKYALRFVLDKPRRGGRFIDIAWLSPEQCQLVCVFADSGNPLTSVEPISLGDARIEAARGDTAWISPPLFETLRKCCLRHGNTPCGCGDSAAP